LTKREVGMHEIGIQGSSRANLSEKYRRLATQGWDKYHEYILIARM
jgi:hypothetical protein